MDLNIYHAQQITTGLAICTVTCWLIDHQNSCPSQYCYHLSPYQPATWDYYSGFHASRRLPLRILLGSDLFTPFFTLLSCGRVWYERICIAAWERGMRRDSTYPNLSHSLQDGCWAWVRIIIPPLKPSLSVCCDDMWTHVHTYVCFLDSESSVSVHWQWFLVYSLEPGLLQFVSHRATSHSNNLGSSEKEQKMHLSFALSRSFLVFPLYTQAQSSWRDLLLAEAESLCYPIIIIWLFSFHLFVPSHLSQLSTEGREQTSCFLRCVFSFSSSADTCWCAKQLHISCLW